MGHLVADLGVRPGILRGGGLAESADSRNGIVPRTRAAAAEPSAVGGNDSGEGRRVLPPSLRPSKRRRDRQRRQQPKRGTGRGGSGVASHAHPWESKRKWPEGHAGATSGAEETNHALISDAHPTPRTASISCLGAMTIGNAREMLSRNQQRS